MSQHQRPSLKARLLGRGPRAEDRLPEQGERGCVQPVKDPRLHAHGFFKPLA